MIRNAIISDCGTFRYRLSRTWNEGMPKVCFIMLNPSVADGLQDDPTIRRCVRFAKDWECGGIVVVNMFAYRSTDPKVLKQKRIEQIVGPDNIGYQVEAINECDIIVAAWGATPRPFSYTAIFDLCQVAGKQLMCLGKTKGGQPRHPLMLKANTLPVPLI